MPDYVASWYDSFSGETPGLADDLWYERPRIVDDWRQRLIARPHTTATEIAALIEVAPRERQRERTFRALQAASSAIEQAGISTVRIHGGPEWTAIRQHWWDSGNLLFSGSGFLLPRRTRPYAWQGAATRETKIYHPAAFLPGFLRVVADHGIAIRMRTMPDTSVPVEDLSAGLRVGVAPLISSLDEFRFEPIDSGGRRAFRVGLVSPGQVITRAMRAIARAGRLNCDILMMPELCLPPSGQDHLRHASWRLTSHHGRPWLIVAGSSLVQARSGGYQNRSVVFDGRGDEKLTHNKLFPYEMSRREATRYGLGEALREEPRVEDIVVHPRRLEILECAMGRTAVLICEDLSNISALSPIVAAFEIDWLLVPVMDGVQTDKRWTAMYSQIFANEFGTNVIVATSKAMVLAHRADSLRGDEDLGTGCALITQSGAPGASAHTTVLTLGEGHPSLAYVDLPRR